MADGPAMIRPHHRRTAAAAAATEPVSDADRRTRVLIRLPLVRGDTPARLPEMTRSPAEGSSTAEQQMKYRIDAAHTKSTEPHLVPAESTAKSSGWLPAVLERKSILALTLIGIGVLVLVQISLQSHRDAPSDQPAQDTKAAKSAPEANPPSNRPTDTAPVRTADVSASAVRYRADVPTSTSAASATNEASPANGTGPILPGATMSAGPPSFSTSNNAAWQTPAATNSPASLGPTAGAPSGNASRAGFGAPANGSTTSVVPSIPFLPDYRTPSALGTPTRDGNANSAAPGVKAALRGDIDKLPPTVMQ